MFERDQVLRLCAKCVRKGERCSSVVSAASQNLLGPSAQQRLVTVLVANESPITVVGNQRELSLRGFRALHSSLLLGSQSREDREELSC